MSTSPSDLRRRRATLVRWYPTYWDEMPEESVRDAEAHLARRLVREIESHLRNGLEGEQ